MWTKMGVLLMFEHAAYMRPLNSQRSHMSPWNTCQPSSSKHEQLSGNTRVRSCCFFVGVLYQSTLPEIHSMEEDCFLFSWHFLKGLSIEHWARHHWKINILNPKMEGDGSDHVPFRKRLLFRFQSLAFPGFFMCFGIIQEVLEIPIPASSYSS